MPPQAVDAPVKLVRGRYVVTIDPTRRILDDGAVVVERDRIVAVDTYERLRRQFGQAHEFGGPDVAVLPGLVNAHMHLAASLWRGYIDDMTLLDHDVRYMFPGQRAMTPQITYAASLLSGLELLMSGVTTTADAYLHPDATIRALVALGTRALVSPSMMDSWLGDGAGPVVTSTQSALDGVVELHGEWNGTDSGRIRVCPAPFTDLSASPALMYGSAELAGRWGTPLQIHMCETHEGVSFVRRSHGLSVFEYAEKAGLFGRAPVLAAHCCWVSEPDIAVMKRHGVSVAYCPSSEAKMADGIPPVTRFLADGLAVAIAIDATSENNTADLFREAKVGAILQKVVPPYDPQALPVEKALDMITIDAARALGMEKDIGSLEPGKKADLITVRIDGPHFVPLLSKPTRTIVNHLVYGASGRDVDDVFVDGRPLMMGRQVHSVDEREVIRNAQKAIEEFVSRTAIGAHGGTTAQLGDQLRR
jgi:5-methylthioadenosine/S-adenosylhomocysteine deaminase